MKNLYKFIFLSSFLLLLNCAGFKAKPLYTSGEKKSTEMESPEKATEPYSDKNMDLYRERLMGEIEDLLGVPYRLGGMSRRGLDCSGFVNIVFQNALNLELPRRVIDLAQTGTIVARNDLRFGDLIFFKNITSPKITHVGIFLDAGQFVHASESQGVIISRLDETYYAKRYAGARRVIR